MALTFIVTNAGRAALVNAANTGTAPVTIAQVGLTATAVTPTVTTGALPGEFKRLTTLSGDVVADDTIHLIVRDESGDVFTVRSIAMYLADGTLFGIYGQAAVLIEKSAQAMMLLGIDVKFEDINATTITFGNANFLNPPATTEMQGVVELSTVAEAQAGIDALRALTPATAKAAILGWLLAQDGSGSGLDADLLDGQDGSYYSNIPQRLGYTPANKAGDTFTGYTKVRYSNRYAGQAIQNDYASASQIASVFLDALNENSIVAGNMTFDINVDGSSAWYVSLSNAGSRTVDRRITALTVNTSAMYFMGSTVWHSGNDGAGSGLDADLLDGQDSSYYTNVPGRLGYTPANKAGDSFTGTVSIAKNGSQELHFSGTGNYKWRAIGLNAVGSGGNFSLQYTTDNFVSSFVNGLTLTTAGSASTAVQGTLWGAANDGAGSGLDADLLDGQDGSYYSNIPQRLGYTPLNRAGDNVTGNFLVDGELTLSTVGSTGFLNRPNVAGKKIIYVSTQGGGPLEKFEVSSTLITFNGGVAWHSNNDGSGSGLDADLLDGQDGSYYSNVPGRLGYTPANKAGETFTGPVTLDGGAGTSSLLLKSPAGQYAMVRLVRGALARWDIGMNTVAESGGNAGSDLFFNFFNDAGGYVGTAFTISRATGNVGVNYSLSVGGTITRGGNLVWDAGNDGSGSGLDADLLDGLQGSDYAKMSDFANNLSAAGYQKLPNGLILQWCTTATQQNVETTATATFPIQFPNAVLDVQLTTRVDIASIEADTWYQLVGDPSLSGCTVMRARSDNDADRPSYCRIFALGR